MSDHDHRTADEKAVDDLTKSRFRTEAAEDRSGLFGQSPPPLPDDATEDQRFDAHMERFFGQRAGAQE